ncbi:MAG: hypothetical protein ABSG42_01140 [Nitrospirota bacterium]
MTGRYMNKIMSGLLLAGLVLASSQAFAKDNLCTECHTSREVASFGNVMGWDRSIYQEKGTLCPGIIELKKENYFTESRLVKYNEFLTHLEHQTRRYPEYLREDLVSYGVKYADLASGTPASIDEFAVPNLKIKKNIHSVYEKLNNLRDDYKMEKVIGLGLLGVTLIAFLFFLGLKNTIKE